MLCSGSSQMHIKCDFETQPEKATLASGELSNLSIIETNHSPSLQQPSCLFDDAMAAAIVNDLQSGD
jgi:hypothetical protein